MHDSDSTADQTKAPMGLVYGFAGFRFDTQALRLSRGTEPVHLERKPLELLRCLLERAGEVVSKADLHQLVWPGRVLSESVLTKAMARLRQGLGPEAASIVRTVHGYGYRFDAVVTMTQAVSNPARADWRVGQKVPRARAWTLSDCLCRRPDYEDWLARNPQGERTVFRVIHDPLLMSRVRPAAVRSTRLQMLGGGFQRIEGVDLSAPPFYLRLQYCAGGTLPSWCASRGGLGSLALDSRLRLFGQVAAAVADAHAIGELVGPLRPEDLLLCSAQSSEPRLSIRAPGLNGSDGDATPRMYQAPEFSIEGTASTRADVYALGVLLFQFVVGDFERIFAPGWEGEISDLLLREDIAIAAASDPTRRIGSVQTLGERVAALDARRQQRAEEEARARAATQASLEAEALRQRLLGLEQRRRWLRRLSATAAVGLLVAGWGYRSAVLARDQAQQQADIAEQVSAFLTEDVLRAADPLSPVHSQSLTALLEQAEQKAGARFTQQPVSMAHVLRALALAWQGHGEWQRAAQLLDAAVLLLSEAQSGQEDALALKIAIQRAEVATLLADFGGAERRYLALQQHPAARSPDGHAWLSVQLGRAYLDYERGLHAESVAAYEDILRVMRSRGELNRLFDANWSLPDVYLELGRASDAQSAIEEVIHLRSLVLGTAHPEIWWQRLTLGDALAMQGQMDAASRLYTDAEEGLARAVGAAHPYTLTARHYRGHHFLDQGDFAQAIPLLQSALQGRETVHGPEHLWTLYSYSRTGEALLRSGDITSGLPLLETAYSRSASHYGEASPHTLEMRMSLAEALLADRDQSHQIRGAKLIQDAESWVAMLPPTHIRKRRWEALSLSLKGRSGS